MNVKKIWLVGAFIWLAAAAFTYLSDPEDWERALLWLALAGLFVTVGLAQKRPKG